VFRHAPTRATFLGALSAAAALPGIAMADTGVMPPSALNRARRVALVLSGGAARGAYEAGVVAGLVDAGYRFDVVCGASIGGINGAFVAQNDVDGLIGLWSSIHEHPLLVPKRAVRDVMAGIAAFEDPSHGLLSRPYDALNGIRKGVRDGLLRQIGVFEWSPVRAAASASLRLEDLRLPLMVSVTNVRSQRSEAIHCQPADTRSRVAVTNIRGGFAVHDVDAREPGNTDAYRDAVFASAALPGAFDPVEFRGEYFADGGVANNAPATLARKFGVDAIVAVLLDPHDESEKAIPKNFVELAFALYVANQRRTILSDFVVASTLSVGGQPPPSIYVVRPTRPLEIGALDFDRADRIENAIAQGRADGRLGPTLLPAYVQSA